MKIWTTRQSVQRIKVEESALVNLAPCNVQYFPVPFPGDLYGERCLICNPTLLINPLEPDPQATSVYAYPSFGPTPVGSTIDSAVFGNLASGTFVLASDAPDLRQGSRFGAVVNPDTHAVSFVLSKNDRGVVVSEPGSVIAPLALSQSTRQLVAAVSGRRQEIAFFGDGPQEVRLYDFDTRTPRTQSLLSGALNGPVAATYRVEDDAYYVLDVGGPVNHVTARIVRIPRSYTAEAMASWKMAAPFPNYALTSGRGGQLVLSAWSARAYRIALLNVDPAGTILRPACQNQNNESEDDNEGENNGQDDGDHNHKCKRAPFALHLYGVYSGNDAGLAVPARAGYDGVIFVKDAGARTPERLTAAQVFDLNERGLNALQPLF
jgi:hypothetical protein